MAKEKAIKSFQDYCKTFEDDAAKLRVPTDRKDGNYVDDISRNEQLKQMQGFFLYNYTKNFLEGELSLTPQERGAVFIEYVRLWKRCNCKLSLEMAGFSEHYVYTELVRGLNRVTRGYQETSPMVAGFNLLGAEIAPEKDLSLEDMTFVAANLSQAKLSSKVLLTNVAFHNCTLVGLKVEGSFSGVVFDSCNLSSAKLSKKSEYALFTECDLSSARVNHDHCPYLRCVVDARTSGVSKDVLSAANKGEERSGCQDMSRKEVKDFWQEELSQGKHVPIVFRRFLPGCEVPGIALEPRKTYDQAVKARDLRVRLEHLIRCGQCKPTDVEEAVANGVNLNVVLGDKQPTLFYLAIVKANAPVALDLLSRTHDKKRMLRLGFPLRVAAESDVPGMADIFRVAKNYISVNETNDSGVPALEFAIRKQNEAAVKSLIESGANTRRLQGRENPAAIAVRLPNVAIARMVIEAQFLLGIKFSDNKLNHDWPLREAMFTSEGPFIDMIKMLVLEFGIDLLKNHDYLFIAVKSGKPEVVAFFLEKGVNPNIVDTIYWRHAEGEGSTPLHWLRRVGEKDIFSAVNSPVDREANAIAIAELLLNAGANLGVVNKDGNTPLQVLEKKKPEFEKLIAFLTEQRLSPPSNVVAVSSVAIQGEALKREVKKI